MHARRTGARAVKRSAAAALVCISLCPHAAHAGAPVFYSAPPAPERHVESAPFAGPVNYGSGGAFRWGWFGAERFCPPTKYHRGYNGDVWNWSRTTWR